MEARAERPMRRCIVTREIFPKECLVRFVAGPGGEIVPDIEGRLPGRGLWLSAERDVVNAACSKGFFAKAAKGRARAPAGMADLVERLLVRRCLNLVGLARRAGQVVAGFEKVRARLRRGEVGALAAAADGACGGREKLAALAPDAPRIEVLSGAELGAALGREQTIHMVLEPGRMAESLLGEVQRLKGFRSV